MSVTRLPPEQVRQCAVVGIDRQRFVLPICNRRSCVLAENQLGGSARNHMGRCVRRPRNDPWHHRCVGHAQAQKSMHAHLWVDNGELIHTHLAGAHWVSKARRGKPGQFPDLLGRRPGPRNDFGLAQTVEGVIWTSASPMAALRSEGILALTGVRVDPDHVAEIIQAAGPCAAPATVANSAHR
jgi:hypothetical protein